MGIPWLRDRCRRGPGKSWAPHPSLRYPASSAGGESAVRPPSLFAVSLGPCTPENPETVMAEPGNPGVPGGAWNSLRSTRECLSSLW